MDSETTLDDYGPSQAALDASCYDRDDVFGDGRPSYSPETEERVRNAHARGLGEDRSVCLADVLAYVSAHAMSLRGEEAVHVERVHQMLCREFGA